MKKYVASFLALSLAVSMLAGCGGATASTGTQSTAASTAQEAAAPTEYKVIGVRGEGVTPFAECEIFAQYEKDANVKINWTDWSQTVQKEKLNLVLASGELPDAFYGSWSFLTSNDVVREGNNGLLKDLKPYINAETMPNFTKIVEQVPEIMTSLQTPSGEIYALPNLNMIDLPQTNDTLMINTQWLEKVGKTMPTTIDELYDVLKAFKAAGDLNGNGKADEVPFTFRYAGGNHSIISFMGFTGLVMNNLNERIAVKDGEFLFAPKTEEYKELLTYLNKLYAEGLVDIEAFTMDPSAYSAKTQVPEPVAGVIVNYTAELVNNSIEGNDVEKPGVYQYVAPLKGNNGVAPVWNKRQNPVTANVGFLMSASVENPEPLLKWIDLQYAPINSFQTAYGKIGVQIKDEGNGTYSKIKKADGTDFTGPEISAYFPNKHGTYFLVDNGEFKVLGKESVQGKKAADAFYAPYFYDEYSDLSLMKTAEEAEEISNILPDLVAYVDQMTAEFVTQGNIDAKWEEYTKHLETLQVERYEEIIEGINARKK